MQSKTLALLALSVSAAVAGPFHKRQELHHHHFHGTGTDAIMPTGSGRPIPAVNDTNGFFAPSGDSSSVLVTFGNAEASSSCASTSIATETLVNLVTVTAAARDLDNTRSVSAGAFYGGQSRSWTGSWSQSSAPVATNSVPTSSAVSVANPSTTFASMPSASKSGIASYSASASASASVSASASKSGVASGSASASVSASASATIPSTGSSGGKRGISYNDASLVAAFGNSVSWAYNWGSSEGGSLGVEYVPMMWGKDQVSGFASQVGSATHVLSFNEPDLSSQSNIDPQTAAQLHKEGMADLIGKVQIGSPAVTNGAGTSPAMGTVWLDQFLTACGTECGITFVAYHWYATADSIEYFKTHTQDVIDVATKHGISKVWLTEFEPSGSADAQASFMTEAVSFLDSTAAVERYAAFMASDGTMLSGTTLNSVGSAYAAAS